MPPECIYSSDASMKSFRLYKRYGAAGDGSGAAGDGAGGCAAKDVTTAYISARPLTCVAGCHGTRTNM